MKKTVAILGMLLTLGSAALFEGCKKKDDNSNNNNNNGGGTSSGPVALSIQTGARTIEPGGTMTYEAVFVDSKGNTSAASNVTWSVNNSLGAFAGGVFTPSTSGSGTVTASATVDGKTLTAKVAVGVYLPAVFTTLPSAIVWTTGAGTIPLNNVYIGTGTISSYSYSSSNNAIASVDASGVVSFNATGECIITVTANGISGNNKVYIPVLVVGMPTVTLPVVRVAVNPPSEEMFRGESVTLTARAYNSSNAEVSSTFTWASQNPDVATVDASGKVTAKALGKAIITATTAGIVGQAEVDVMPDTAIIVTPFMGSISPGGTKQFTAQAYTVNKSNRSLSAISMPAGLTWEVPTTGISMFDIATVSATGLVTMKSSASMGMSTVVIAHVASPTISEGGALVMVSDCNCGTTTPGVTQISVSGGTNITMSLMGGPITITAQAEDAGGNPVAGAALSMCTDDMSVANVDKTSMTIIPAGPGTCKVTICNGGVEKVITVTVTL